MVALTVQALRLLSATEKSQCYDPALSPHEERGFINTMATCQGTTYQFMAAATSNNVEFEHISLVSAPQNLV